MDDIIIRLAHTVPTVYARRGLALNQKSLASIVTNGRGLGIN